jgi:hypothetical protein
VPPVTSMGGACWGRQLMSPGYTCKLMYKMLTEQVEWYLSWPYFQRLPLVPGHVCESMGQNLNLESMTANPTQQGDSVSCRIHNNLTLGTLLSLIHIMRTHRDIMFITTQLLGSKYGTWNFF